MRSNPIYAVICFAVMALFSSCTPDDIPCDGKANDVFFDITDRDSSLIPLFNKQQVKYLRTQKNNGVKDTIVLNKSLQRKNVEPYAVSTDDICPTQYWETTYEFIFKSVSKHFEIYYIFTNHQRRFNAWDFVNETMMELNITNETPLTFSLYQSRNNMGDEIRRQSQIKVLNKTYQNVIQSSWGYGTLYYANDYGILKYDGRYVKIELVP